MKLAIGQQMLRYQGIRVIPTPKRFELPKPPQYSMIHISLLPTFGRGAGFGAVSFNSKETGGGNQTVWFLPQARAVSGPIGGRGGGADSSSAIRIRSEPAKLPASAVRSRSRPRWMFVPTVPRGQSRIW